MAEGPVVPSRLLLCRSRWSDGIRGMNRGAPEPDPDDGARGGVGRDRVVEDDPRRRDTLIARELLLNSGRAGRRELLQGRIGNDLRRNLGFEPGVVVLRDLALPAFGPGGQRSEGGTASAALANVAERAHHPTLLDECLAQHLLAQPAPIRVSRLAAQMQP